MNLLNWLKKPTNHPKQELTDKQQYLLNLLDNELVVNHCTAKTFTGAMCVKTTGVPFMSTLKTVAYMFDHIELETGGAYIPRSIALIVDADGNWIFMYALRCEQGSDYITNTLFLDALNRTNAARSVSRTSKS